MGSQREAADDHAAPGTARLPRITNRSGPSLRGKAETSATKNTSGRQWSQNVSDPQGVTVHPLGRERCFVLNALSCPHWIADGRATHVQPLSNR